MKKITILEEPGKRAEIDRPDIVEVYATELFKRNGERKGYRYTALLADGSKVIVRGHATRLYEKAFLYDHFVATGKVGLASAFSFGKNPTTSGSAQVIVTFPIMLESQDAPEPEIEEPAVPVATTDNDGFAQSVAWAFMRSGRPFSYAFQELTGLHVFTADPKHLEAAFDRAREIWAP